MAVMLKISCNPLPSRQPLLLNLRSNIYNNISSYHPLTILAYISSSFSYNPLFISYCLHLLPTNSFIQAVRHLYQLFQDEFYIGFRCFHGQNLVSKSRALSGMAQAASSKQVPDKSQASYRAFCIFTLTEAQEHYRSTIRGSSSKVLQSIDMKVTRFSSYHSDRGTRALSVHKLSGGLVRKFYNQFNYKRHNLASI